MYPILKHKWSELSSLAKAGLISGVILILGSLLLGSLWLLNDDYQILFSELNAQDASAMVTELDRMKIPYRLAEGGTAILVERDAVYKTRLKLMGKGLDLRGGVGFEIFNNADLGMTEFAQKVNFQRALQGELARTIMSLDEVKSARVHLVLPDSSLFKRQNARPKASISLIMKGNTQLSPEQISGMQRLVAASVPEIDSASVTIVDHHGVAISKPSTDDAAQGVSGRLDSKRQVEDYLARKIVAVLDRAVGPGKAIVSVDAVLNYDQVKVTKEDVLPLPNTTGQSVGAIARRRESVQGGDSYSELFAGNHNVSSRGVQSGVPGATSSEVEFVNGRRVEQVVSLPGGIRRLSVGVMVPEVSDPVELAKLKEVVAMAAGINPGRGDAIVVYNHVPVDNRTEAPPDPSDQIDTPTPVQDSRSAGHAQRFAPPVSYLVIALALVATLAAVLVLRMRRLVGQSESQLTPSQREQLLREISLWAAKEKT